MISYFYLVLALAPPTPTPYKVTTMLAIQPNSHYIRRRLQFKLKITEYYDFITILAKL